MIIFFKKTKKTIKLYNNDVFLIAQRLFYNKIIVSLYIFFLYYQSQDTLVKYLTFKKKKKNNYLSFKWVHLLSVKLIELWIAQWKDRICTKKNQQWKQTMLNASPRFCIFKQAPNNFKSIILARKIHLQCMVGNNG